MKKWNLLFFAGIVFISCNNNGTKKDTATTETQTSVSAVKVDYPYTIDHPDNWETGSSANTLVALKALKGFENGNIEECMKYFGDSVHIMFDHLDTTLSNDSLKTMFSNIRSGFKNMSIKMYDWEPVISKDKSEEYVTIWYKQYQEYNKGKSDSAMVVNDFKMKNGKIIELSEYVRKL